MRTLGSASEIGTPAASMNDIMNARDVSVAEPMQKPVILIFPSVLIISVEGEIPLWIMPEEWSVPRVERMGMSSCLAFSQGM